MTELVGKGKPFHSALDLALGSLPEKASPEQVVNHLLKLGVKPQELIDRRMDQAIGAPLIPRERTVKLKKPDNKGRTEIVEPYFETTSVKGAKSIPRSMVAELASKNPAPAIHEKVLGKISDSEFFQKANEIAEDYYGVPYGKLNHEEQMKVESDINENTAHHQGLTLPGGENYREMLIKAPEAKDLFEGVGAHFGGERGILASMRLKDRIGPGDMGYTLVNMRSGNKSQHYNTEQEAREAMQSMPESMRPMLFIQHTRGPNKKLLHLEELQSDWHQQGREHGYINPEEDWRIIKKLIRNEPLSQEENNTRLSSLHGPKVPDAPFKKNWEEMALKRLIHHAAEKGYHGIVVTPGAEQADRYGLAEHVGELVHWRDGDEIGLSAVTPNGRDIFSQEYVKSSELKKLVGKDLAEKIINGEGYSNSKFGFDLSNGEKAIRGPDLQVGGEGMKGFYDKKVPNILNGIGKKYGVKTELNGHTIKKFSANNPNNLTLPGQTAKPAPTTQLHHFPITEEMRQDVLTNGLPLYAEGGGVPEQHRARFNQVKSEIEARVKINDEYEKQMSRLPLEQIMPFQEWLKTRVQHKAEGGNVQPSVNHMRMALMSNGKFPYTDLQNIGAEEAPSMGVKAYVNPDHGNAMSPGGVSMNNQQLPIGGIDMNTQQPGQQMMPQMQQPAGQVAPSPLSAGQSSPGQQQPSNILQMTPQGQAMNAMTPPKQMAQGGSLHYRKSRALKQSEIDAMAERMSRQMAQLENPNKKTLKQLKREQNLPINIKSVGTKNTQPIIDFQKLKGASTVGVPGDPSRGGLLPSKKVNPRYGMNMPQAGELLSGIGTTQLEHDIPLFGGYDYGAYGGPDAWASDLGASAGMFNVVKGLHKENPDQDIYGHYHKMTPDSLNHAVHMLDAVMHYHQPHKSGANRISYLNHLMQNVKTTTDKNDIPYPEFPGFENPEDVMLHGTMNSGMRKKIINLLGTEKHFPGGKQKLNDIIFAISHPELRNIETGAGGSAIIKFDPSRDLKTSLSEHPTYAHDIPSSLVGRTRYITPAKILAPRSMQNAEREIKAMGKKVVPFNQAKMNIIREPFDEQYINQMGAYEQAMKKRLGYKSGGKVKETTNLDTMKLQLMRKPKKAK